MAIMGYQEWMRKTRLGFSKPRSGELRVLDAAIKDFEKRQNKESLNACIRAFQLWAESKDNWKQSKRNTLGGITELHIQLSAEFNASKKFDSHIANVSRGPKTEDHLAQIRGGANRLKEGKLTGKYPSIGPTMITDPTYPNVYYEGFAGDNLQRAIRGFADAMKGAEKAVSSMRAVTMGMASGMGRPDAPETRRFQTWFGTPTRQTLDAMSQKAETMLTAMKTRPITFVLRENITIHYVNGQDPLGPMVDDVIGSGVYGYVWNASNHTGSGMRIVLCGRFITKPCIYEGPAATIYHELTHKVLATSDKTSAGVTTYGIEDCKELAKKHPEEACKIADNWSYYAISFLKKI